MNGGTFDPVGPAPRRRHVFGSSTNNRIDPLVSLSGGRKVAGAGLSSLAEWRIARCGNSGIWRRIWYRRQGRHRSGLRGDSDVYGRFWRGTGAIGRAQRSRARRSRARRSSRSRGSRGSRARPAATDLGRCYEVSCVACHNLGGTGGGGPREQDVVMLTPVAGSDRSLAGATVFQGELEDLHPGFRNHGSVVLHRHAIRPEMQNRLEKIDSITVVQTRDEIKVLRKGSRNARRSSAQASSMRFPIACCAKLRSELPQGSPKSRVA